MIYILLYIFYNQNFRRTQLTEKEHDLVIKSLCSYLDEMKPQEIPPLLQQIINFCKNEDYLDVFCTLQKYFDDKYIENHNNEENNAFPIGIVNFH